MIGEPFSIISQGKNLIVAQSKNGGENIYIHFTEGKDESGKDIVKVKVERSQPIKKISENSVSIRKGGESEYLDIHLNDKPSDNNKQKQVIEHTINGKKIKLNLLDKPVQIISENENKMIVRTQDGEVLNIHFTEEKDNQGNEKVNVKVEK